MQIARARGAMFVAALSLLVACGEDDPPLPAEAPEPSPAEEPPGEEPHEEPPEAADPDGVEVVGPLVLGTPSVLVVPPAIGPEGQRDLVLAATRTERLRCDAHAEQAGESRDAQMGLLRDGTTLQQNSDGGERFDARITFDAEPGTYHVRVWEWLHRDATITVTCARAPAEEPPRAAPTEAAPPEGAAPSEAAPSEVSD